MSVRDAVHLRGLEFFAYHGVLSEEAKLGQKFSIDVDFYLDLKPAGDSDRVEDTVSYAEVYQVIHHCVTENRFQLIESLAEKIAQEILAGFPCQSVRVEVHKPGAPIAAVFRDVSVEIWREREV